MTRLSPSELVMLIDPPKMWGYDTIRADLTALILDGWAEARPSGSWLVSELLLYPPRGPDLYPDHVRALHDVLARAAGGQPIRGATPGSYDKRGPIEKALAAAWGLGAGTAYSLRMVAPSLQSRGLVAQTQGNALFGLAKPMIWGRTQAGQAVGAAMDRRLAALLGGTGLLKSDPALAVAIGCSLGTLLSAASETQVYRALGVRLAKLAEAASQLQGPLPPLPAPFALAPGEEAWAALAPPPLTPAGLVALARGHAELSKLNIVLNNV